MAGNFVYETAVIEVADGQLLSRHGANFFNRVCPWQIICPLELFEFFECCPIGSVLQSVYEILTDSEFVVLAVDY